MSSIRRTPRHPADALVRACLVTACFATTLACASWRPPDDPLPSWNAGPVKASILDFVDRTSTPGGPDFVPKTQRIAVFDNDGTLWSEKPLYVQLLFVLERVEALAPEHPEWKTTQPFQAVLEKDMETIAKSGHKGLLELVAATHSGMTGEEFDSVARGWLAEARHPRFDRPYTDLVYQPMLEVLDLLRAHGFKTYIVSGGGVAFMRPWTEEVYGIPPEQVLGSSLETRFEMRPDGPVIVRLPEIAFIDDKEGKPVNIDRVIGRRPIAAFGNSDGDLAMLQWTAAGAGPSLQVLVHHTDADREWAYDRKSSVGRLDRALVEATERDWTVVDMKRDWRSVYPFEAPRR